MSVKHSPRYSKRYAERVVRELREQGDPNAVLVKLDDGKYTVRHPDMGTMGHDWIWSAK